MPPGLVDGRKANRWADISQALYVRVSVLPRSMRVWGIEVSRRDSMSLRGAVVRVGHRVACGMLLATVVALAGCGGSSSSSSTGTSDAAKTTAGAAITQASSGGGSAGGLKGAAAVGRSHSASRTNGAALKGALVKFASCLRENGVKLPAPNTAGKGPVFDTKGVNTKSAQFRAAETKCSGVLRAAFKAGTGRAGSARAAGPAGTVKPAPVVRPKVKVPPAITHELEHFTACMREHGVAGFPEPEGASFNVTHLHLNSKSTGYKAAEKACEPILQAAFSAK